MNQTLKFGHVHSGPFKDIQQFGLYLRAQKEIEKGIAQNSLPVTIMVTCYSISQGKRCVWQFQGQNRPIFILSSAHVMPKLVQANLWCIMTTHQPPFAIVIGRKQTTPSVQTRHGRLHEAIQPLLTSHPALFQSSWGHCLWNMTVGSIHYFLLPQILVRHWRNILNWGRRKGRRRQSTIISNIEQLNSFFKLPTCSLWNTCFIHSINDFKYNPTLNTINDRTLKQNSTRFIFF